MKQKEFKDADYLRSFLYDLLKGYGAGHVEELVKRIETEKSRGIVAHIYSNGWLADYADELAQRIRKVDDGKVFKLKQINRN